MDAKRISLITILITSLLAPATVWAQEAGRATPSQAPAMGGERISTLEGSAAAYRSGGSMNLAFAGGATQGIAGCVQCRGWLIEALLRWTDRMVTKLDPIGLVETPFETGARDTARTPDAGAPRWRPVPRLRPVQLYGGYGLVARITF
ncbi:MAG TPA: hypothetical protein VI197_17065 [Polyangiaceae bacterium]